MELTEEQARKEFKKLSDEDIRLLCIREEKPVAGMTREQMIELLLGKCAGCKGGSQITVVIISKKGKKSIQKKASEPCFTCGK